MKPNNGRKDLIAIATSLGIHTLLLLAFVFLVSWKAPNPPLSALGGIELNFGLDEVGSGDIQPTKPVGIDEPKEPETPAIDESKEQLVEPIVEKSAETLSSKEESPVEVPKPIDIKKTEATKIPDEKKKEDVKQISESKTPAVTDSEKKIVSQRKGTEGNQGDDKNKVGDKGNPSGTLDANALYGKPGIGGTGGSGSGGGFALQMAGWTWDESPKAPKLPDNENGRVVFEIEVDADGEITSIKTLERSLSPEAEKICKQEVLRRSLVKTTQGNAPERSKGRVAFVLRTQ